MSWLLGVSKRLIAEFEVAPRGLETFPACTLYPSRLPKFWGMDPVRLLCDTSNTCRLLRSPIHAGIGPSNWLYEIKRTRRLDRWLPSTWVDSLPVKLFLLKSIKASVEFKLAKVKGRFPSNLLFEIEKAYKLGHQMVKSSYPLGRMPERLLSLKKRYSRDEQFCRDGGIDPERLFPCKVRVCKCLRDPSSVGMWPVKQKDVDFMRYKKMCHHS